VTGGLARSHARQVPDRQVPGSQMSASQRSAAAIVGALSAAGTRLLFGIPGGGPNLDVVGAAAASGLRFILAHGETAATIMAATCADLITREHPAPSLSPAGPGSPAPSTVSPTRRSTGYRSSSSPIPSRRRTPAGSATSGWTRPR